MKKVKSSNDTEDTEYESQVFRLTKRFLPDGSEHASAIALAEKFFKPLLRSFASTVVPESVVQWLNNHRPLLMEQATMGEHMRKNRKSINTIRKKEGSSFEGIEPTPSRQIDEFEFYLLSRKNTVKGTLKPLIKTLKQNSEQNNVKIGTSKEECISFLKNHLKVDEYKIKFPQGLSCKEGIQAFKKLCTEKSLPCFDPMSPWVPGMTINTLKKGEETIREAIASRDFSYENCMRLNYELNTSDYESIYQKVNS